ncbi:MAG: glycosyl hydrolase [Planctomycetes bacterium]|nr:glycosyl hydrolase [Planctomycetota bacterium]
MKTSRTASSTLLIGTAKGGFALEGIGRAAKLRGPFLFGAKTHDLRADPRSGRTWLMSSTGGHLGPTIYRSIDRGRTWSEAPHPPRFAPARRKTAAPSVKINFWLEPGHADEPDVWYCGTSPQGLFRSEDGGQTWRGVDGWNRNPAWESWTSFGRDGTPDGPVLHSIQIDPRDARHMTVSCSSGGTFESLDQGGSWRPLNRGVAADFLPNPDAEYGHDPHCMRMHPADPDRWYQQNHCGIYRLDRAARAKTPSWTRIGTRMPKAVGDIGFPLVPHPTDADTVWVIPMDGRTIWPRTAVDGRPAVYMTRDGGRSWRRQDRGLPRSHAYWTVLRQAFTSDAGEPLGLYFGTTSGELWGSRDAGGSWRRLLAHLPRIYSVRWSGR